MKASIFYRIAAVLLLLFAAGHSFGFSQVDPGWHVDALVASMQSTRFDMLGFQRSYWELFLALGYGMGLLFLFSAVLAWQLAGLPAETLVRMRLTTWAFALTYVALLAVSVALLFPIPIGFCTAISLCLIAAAWLSSR